MDMGCFHGLVHCGACMFSNWSFPGGLVVKNLPVMQEPQETWVQSLGGEDPLEEEMENYSSILAWRIPWTEKTARLQSMRSQRVRHDWSNLAWLKYKPQYLPVLIFLDPSSDLSSFLVMMRQQMWYIERSIWIYPQCSYFIYLTLY